MLYTKTVETHLAFAIPEMIVPGPAAGPSGCRTSLILLISYPPASTAAGQQYLLFSPQRSTKIRDISEKNSTTKSNRTKGSSNQGFVEPRVRRTKGSQSKKEEKERMLS
jgi:hypothetical protein